MTDDHDDYVHTLTPGSKMEPETALMEYFSSQEGRSPGVLRNVTDLVSVIADRSFETVWPSALKATRSVADHDDPSMKMIRFNNPWKIGLAIAESPSEDCGYMFVFDINKVQTEAALARQTEEFKRARQEAKSAPHGKPFVSDKELFANALIKQILSEEKMVQRNDDYCDPDTVDSIDQVTLYAYGRHSRPDGYYGAVLPLEELLVDVEQQTWARGLAASYSPAGKKPHTDTYSSGSSARLSCISALFPAFHGLSQVIDAVGFNAEVRSRAREISNREYLFFGGPDKRLLAEEAQLSIRLDDGIPGAASKEAVEDYIESAIGWEITARSPQIREVIETLRERGHTSADTQYDCNDLDDFGYVVMKNSTEGVFWLRTQNGNYAITFSDKETSLTTINIHRIKETSFGDMDALIERGCSEVIATSQARNTASGWEANYDSRVPNKISDRTIRGFNDVVDTIDSMDCCLKEEPSQTLKV